MTEHSAGGVVGPGGCGAATGGGGGHADGLGQCDHPGMQLLGLIYENIN